MSTWIFTSFTLRSQWTGNRNNFNNLCLLSISNSTFMLLCYFILFFKGEKKLFLKFLKSLVLIEKWNCSIFYFTLNLKIQIKDLNIRILLNFDSCLKVNLVFNEIFWTANSRPEGNNSSSEKVIFWPNYTFDLTTKSVNKSARFDHDFFWCVFPNLLHTGDF